MTVIKKKEKKMIKKAGLLFFLRLHLDIDVTLSGKCIFGLIFRWDN